MGQSKTPKSFRRSQPARNSDWRPPAFSIGGAYPFNGILSGIAQAKNDPKEWLFVVRTDSGHERFNFSESTGNAVAAAISNAYHVREDRTASRNASTFAFLILYDGMNNELKEFWPDIRRKVFHKNTP
jgi:hypothetical protein